jgi:hypothetical protein
MGDQDVARDVVRRLSETRFDEKKQPRRYIGASIVGDQCDQYLALSLRGMPSDEPEARTLRIFRDGHTVEQSVIKDLKRAGFSVTGTDAELGQFEFEIAGGHVLCHLDGLMYIGGETYVLEIKSMNKASHSQVRLRGLKRAYFKYYDQMQLCMNLSGVHQGMFVAYCKDNSEYYAEVIPYDPPRAEFIVGRVLEIVEKGSGKRISESPRAKGCTTCFKRTSCWTPLAVKTQDCPQCRYSTPITNQPGAKWYCNRHQREATAKCKDFSVYRKLT